MRTASKRIAGAFQLIDEVLDELSHAEKSWLACGWGESVHNTIPFRHIGGCHLTRESVFGAVMDQTIRE